ncbi:bifunctional HAD-like superfamily/HAD superfamily [Babesia duncani]|uniref:Bifunctional HAD-like superfamily/HAD superfamily n=1 Tax=Babesia duncani TaxID=323732 RepID=A0AAD9UQ52_9APIC|nr:bifunctional HAD-like superfamily/HAD superfamily [Babesia duncani]
MILIFLSIVIFPCLGAPVLEFVKPNSPPKYFAMDIDRTFYSKNESAMSKNIDAFKKAKELGNTLFFCTGRPNLKYLMEFGDDVKSKTGYNGCPGIYSNGALVLDSNCCVIDQVSFSKTSGLEHGFLFFNKESAYIIDDKQSSTDESFLRIRNLYNPEKILAEELMQKDILSIFSLFPYGLDGFKEHGPNVDYTLKFQKSVQYMSPLGVTKANGLKLLSQYLGVEPCDIAFIGDGSNDVEAMQQSKISFAMGNASDEVKKHAKYILEHTCDEAGFAKAMSIVYDF